MAKFKSIAVVGRWTLTAKHVKFLTLYYANHNPKKAKAFGEDRTKWTHEQTKKACVWAMGEAVHFFVMDADASRVDL